LAKGAAGIAVLHGIRAQHGHGGLDRVHAWLTHLAQDELSAGPGVGLWFGVPAAAFAFRAAAPGHYRRAVADLDAAVTQLVNTRLVDAESRMKVGVRPLVAEFDLVHGLTGFGAYLLRREPRGDLMGRVLTYLTHVTEPVLVDDEAGRTAPGWWARDAPSPRLVHRYGGGHGNFGMAHGIAGPLALLALAMRHGITVEGHAEAIIRICDWLDSWRQASPAGPWWPEHITVGELHVGETVYRGPARPSWCYGTPGLARAQQLAGVALRDPARQEVAEQALDRCLGDPAQLARVSDLSLCHGWAGLTATVWCAAADARSPNVARHLPSLFDKLLRNADQLEPHGPPGLIDGSSGVALTLHSVATGATGGWETCLLLN
jgi:hypothetical protein